MALTTAACEPSYHIIKENSLHLLLTLECKSPTWPDHKSHK